MVDRTGLFVKPLPGSPAQGTSPTDGRLVLAALSGANAGCLAGGVLTASGTQMQVSINQSVWRIPDPTNGAAAYLTPADPVTLAFSAGPASGSRIDLIWVRQNNYEAGDANSRVVYGVAQGIAASTPTAPAVPAGAMKIGQLTVPTGITNTAACALVTTYPATVVPANLAATTKAQLDQVPGRYVGQRAFADALDYRWNGAAWRAWDSDWFGVQPAVGGVNGGQNASPGYVSTGRWRYQSGFVLFEGNFYFNGGTSALTGTMSIDLPVSADTTYFLRITGELWGVNYSDSQTPYALKWNDTGNRIYPRVASTSASNPGRLADVTSTTPFNEAWGQSDAVHWALRYPPA